MIVYYTADNQAGKRLERLFRQKLRHQRLQVFHRTGDVGDYLCRVGHIDMVFVLVVESMEDLGAFLEMGSMLLDLKTIIVCPLQHGQLVDTALRLYPRYLSSTEGDLLDVLAVVEKLQSRFAAI